MKCPLFHTGDLAAWGASVDWHDDCLQSECAWWQLTPGCCAVLDLAKSLQELQPILKDVAHQTVNIGRGLVL